MADPPHLPLPPPPSDWAPPIPVTQPSPSTALPRWRVARPGWIILHLAIGGAIAFALLTTVLGFLSAGHDLSPINTIDPANPADRDLVVAFGGAFWVCVLGCVIGWLLFVYLRTTVVIRATALAIGILLTGWIAFTIMANALDRV